MRRRAATANIGARGSARAVSWNGSRIVAGAGLTEVSDVFIDDTVAIVIERIAGFVVGRASARANARLEGTGPGACIARDSDTCRAFGSCGARADAAHLHGRRRGYAFVNGAIAVVVDTVACFGGGNVRAGVFALLVVIEVEVAGLATLEGAHAVGAGPIGMDCAGITIVAAASAIGDVRLQVGLVRQLSVAIGVDAACIRRAGWSNRTIALNDATGAALGPGHTWACRAHGRRRWYVAGASCIRGGHASCRIDLAVAIVIDAIACFGAWIDRSDANNRAALALLGSERTREDVRRSARTASIGGVVVDYAVAIVIDAVARFGDRIDRADADEHSVLALLRAVFARTNIGLSALCADTNGGIVDHAIAVIIDAIACFRLRIDGADANEAASLALERSEFARAHIGCSALRTNTCGHVVDGPIAIVVLSVARFRLRIDGSRTNQRSTLTQYRPELARERIVLPARNTRTLRVVVDGSIAIVIDSVAHFRGRIDGADARHLPILALHRPKTARSRAALATLRAYARDVVVDHAIAIVVDSIACFRGGIERSDAL